MYVYSNVNFFFYNEHKFNNVWTIIISKRHLRLSVSQTLQCELNKLINDARKYNLGALELPSLGYAVVFSRERV